MSESSDKWRIGESSDRWRMSELYLRRMLALRGEVLIRFETGHLTTLYFLAEGLALLGRLQPEDKEMMRAYVLSLEIPSGGFAPSSFYTQYSNPHNQFFLPHIVFTYSAISILALTGGMEQINRSACLNSVALCAKPNGSYSNFTNSEEADLRFVYAAVVICHTLDDFSQMDRPSVVRYINSCRNFDGGYGLRPQCESHSGAIYCALAALKLLGEQPQQAKRTLLFLVSRQTVNLSNEQLVGIQGRVGKLPDSCYSFWVGAAIAILTGRDLLNPRVENFIDLCFKETDCSYGKYPSYKSGDPVHTTHALTGLRLARHQTEGLDLVKGVVME